MRCRALLIAFCAITVATASPIASRAETFTFGNLQNNFDGLASKSLSASDFTMTISTGIPGTLLTETSLNGMGIDSRSVAGGSDPTGVFNRIGGTGPLAGAGESVEFSFDRPGVLTGINFDGVKDELLEYFFLESSSGLAVYFFDVAANHPDVPNPNYSEPLNAAIADGAFSGNFLLLLQGGGFDDEICGLNYPFTAGQTFKLTYGAIGPPYSSGLDNGARFQGITVQAVPEPVSLPIALSCAVLSCYVQRSARRRQHVPAD